MYLKNKIVLILSVITSSLHASSVILGADARYLTDAEVRRFENLGKHAALTVLKQISARKEVHRTTFMSDAIKLGGSAEKAERIFTSRGYAAAEQYIAELAAPKYGSDEQRALLKKEQESNCCCVIL